MAADNARHRHSVYGGDENIRAQVRQFLSFLNALATKYEMAVLVLAHPSLSGMASGAGTGGSTAWHNSARSRLYLSPMKSADGDEPDTSLKQLIVMKSNYGPTGEAIPLRWERGRFVLLGAQPPIERMAAERKADDTFIRLLTKIREQGNEVSPNHSSTYAPSVFAKRDDREGIGAKQFEKAMERLLDSRKIKVEIYGFPVAKEDRRGQKVSQAKSLRAQ